MAPEVKAPPVTTPTGAQPPADKPEADDKGKETLLAGKFKTPAELEKGYVEAEKSVTSATERANRAEELLNAYIVGQGNNPPPSTPPPPAAAHVSDYTNVLTDPVATLNKVKADATKEAVESLMAVQQRIEIQRAAKEQFYKTYPDLAGSEIIVGHFAEEVSRQKPNLSLETAMKEVADRAKIYLGKIRDAGKEPPLAVGGGGGGGRPNPQVPTKPPKPLTAEEILLEEVKKRNAARNKVLGL